MWQDVKILIQNLTRCKKGDSRSDEMKNFYLQFKLFTKLFSFRIMLSRKHFTFKIMLFRKNFFLKNVLFKIARNTQKMRILRGKLNQNVIFFVQHFFQNLFYKIYFFFKMVFFRKIFSSNSCFLKIYFFLKNWRVVNFLIQNLTRCKNFDSRSGKMKNFYLQFMLFTKLFSFRIMLSRKHFTFKIMLFRKNVFPQNRGF